MENPKFMTFHILGRIIPSDEFIFFRGVGIPHQPDHVHGSFASF